MYHHRYFGIARVLQSELIGENFEDLAERFSRYVPQDMEKTKSYVFLQIMSEKKKAYQGWRIPTPVMEQIEVAIQGNSLFSP